ncbi:MAG: radical SAM protein [Pseudomonadota bacterium]
MEDLITRLARALKRRYGQAISGMVEEEISRLSIVGVPPRTTRNPPHRIKRLQIGLTDRCNLVCRHCPKLPGSNATSITLSLARFSRYLSSFSPEWFDILVVSSGGELTLMENLQDYLYLAKRAGWNDVRFFTNATRINDALFEEIIVQKLIGSIGISIEAVNPELYENIRKSSHEKFLGFLKSLTRLRDLYSSPMKLAFAVTCMRENLHDLENIARLAVHYGIDEIVMVHIDPFYGADSNVKGKLCVPEQHLRTLDRSAVLEIFERVVRIAEDHGISLVLPEPYPEITNDDMSRHNVIEGQGYLCTVPFRYVQVDFDGEVFPCCRHKRQEYFGNINKLDFPSIYENLKYDRLLRSLKVGSKPIDMCRGCGCLRGENLSL